MQKRRGILLLCVHQGTALTCTSVLERETEDELFVEAIGEIEKTAWFASVHLNGKRVRFKRDTESEVTVISCNTFNTLGHHVHVFTCIII